MTRQYVPRKRADQPAEYQVRLAAVFALLAAAAAVVQVALGCDLIVLLCALLSVAIGLIGFSSIAPRNISGWAFLLYVVGNVLVALYAKTVLGQPLDSYLYAPELSFFVLLICELGLFLALLIAQLIPVGRPILGGTADRSQLAFLSWSCLVLGVVFWYINRLSSDLTAAGSSFGGVNVFRDLLLMSVIARTAMVVLASKGARNFDLSLLIIILCSVGMGILDNSKTHAALPVVSFLCSIAFFGGRIHRRYIVAIVLAGLFFSVVLSPMINSYRRLGVHGMTISERIDLIGDSIATAVRDGNVDRFNQIADDPSLYYHYFGVGTGQLILGRYASVQQVDPVVAVSSRQGELGGSVLWPAFSFLVPSFLYPDKPQGTQAYQIVTALGLYDPAGGKFPTVPLASQAFAAYGWPGLLTVPFATFFVFFMVMKKVGWQMHRNVYSIFFLCQFVIVFFSQGDFAQYVGQVFRTTPLFVAMFLLLNALHRLRRSRSGSSPVRVGSQQD